jgi:hypothetical protein
VKAQLDDITRILLEVVIKTREQAFMIAGPYSSDRKLTKK